MFGKQFKIVFSLCFKKLIQLLKEPNTSTRLFDIVLHQNIKWVIIAQFYKNMYYHHHHHYHYCYLPQPCCSTPFTLMLTCSDTLHDSSNICNMRTSDHLIRFLRLCLSSDNTIRYWVGVRGQKGIPQLWSNFKFYCILNKTKAFISIAGYTNVIEQASPTVLWYPFILLNGETLSELSVWLKNTKKWPSQDWKTELKIWGPWCSSLTLYTLTSVCIFVSLEYVQCWLGKFVSQSRVSLVGDHFLYYCGLHVSFRGVILLCLIHNFMLEDVHLQSVPNGP